MLCIPFYINYVSTVPDEKHKMAHVEVNCRRILLLSGKNDSVCAK